MIKNIKPEIRREISNKRKIQAAIAGTVIVASLSVGTSFADSRYDESDYRGIGYISITEEVGPNGDGSYVSTGVGDYGGISYGLYQFSTTTGSAVEFVKYLQNNYNEFYEYFKDVDKPGTDSFGKAWKNAYKHNPGVYESIQTEFIEKQFVQPAYEKIKNKLGIDMLSSRAKTEFLYSTAVQFGPEGAYRVVNNSKATKDMNDEELITVLDNYKINAANYHFRNSSYKVQCLARERFKREKKELLKIVKEEKGPLLEDENRDNNGEEVVVDTAESYLNQGTKYKMGGKNTDKLDCSGYVSLILQDMGIDVDEMNTNAAKFKSDSKTINRDDLKPGDLVFWNDLTGTKHNKVFHIGMYIGENKVINCSPDDNGVGVRNLSDLQDNNSRFYTYGRYEELSEKISDMHLENIVNKDEFANVEVPKDIENRYKEETKTEDNINKEFDSVVDDNKIKEEDNKEETKTEDDINKEFDSVVDDNPSTDDKDDKKENSQVDEELKEEDKTDNQETDDNKEFDSVVDDNKEETKTEDEIIKDNKEETKTEDEIIKDNKEETNKEDEELKEETKTEDEIIKDNKEETNKEEDSSSDKESIKENIKEEVKTEEQNKTDDKIAQLELRLKNNLFTGLFS